MSQMTRNRCSFPGSLGAPFLIWVLLSALWAVPARCVESDREQIDYADCLACHEGIEDMGPDHAFKCAACHLRPEDGDGKILTGHGKIIRNPSAPGRAQTFCGECHQREIAQMERSLHSTMAGVINQTRYLWGAQDRGAPAIYGLSGPLKPLPRSVPSPETPPMLVDDFLRRQCLRCHIRTRGAQGRGLYRGTGCAACHVIYNHEGTYEGGDRAIDRSKSGYPVTHSFTRSIPSTQCLHCHNHNHVGGDYNGLFEHDYSDTYRSPMVKGRLKRPSYGAWQHRLARDIHGERGLWCVDCHTRKQVMGDGRTYSFQMEVPKRSCTSCHGGFTKMGPDPSVGAIGEDGRGLLFLSKNRGGKHRLPIFSPDSTAHRIRAHAKVRCSACHAQWSYQDYGLSVMREDVIIDYKWLRLTTQGDPYLQERLKRYARSPDTVYPLSVDRISGREEAGIWSTGWRFRRWEPMPLGLDHRGRYALFRPLYQYLISYVDRHGNCLLDSVAPFRGDGTGKGWAFMPCVPHTTAPFGRGCNACHQNRVAAGLGVQEEITIDTVLTIPSPPAVSSMRLLNRAEQERLLKPTKAWHRERLRALTVGD
ncbi:MAG: hypothetical protein JRF51_10240 [Deltaproteobacteria bacterium]|nr:hypothetical protein [Deltaproteobacteria bacterium]MBW2353590.1 hypothetical protein [Deltaproteobacteria bacterium]